MGCAWKDFHWAHWLLGFINQLNFYVAKHISNTIKILYALWKTTQLQNLCGSSLELSPTASALQLYTRRGELSDVTLAWPDNRAVSYTRHLSAILAAAFCLRQPDLSSPEVIHENHCHLPRWIVELIWLSRCRANTLRHNWQLALQCLAALVIINYSES